MTLVSTATNCCSHCPPLLRHLSQGPALSIAVKGRGSGIATAVLKGLFEYLSSSTPLVLKHSGGRAQRPLKIAFHCSARQARSRSSDDSVDVGGGAIEDTAGSGNTSKSLHLILYSKPGCCLCDGLKEKLLPQGGTSRALADIQLEVRDITTNENWWNSYQFEIPVLARLRDDGIEEPLPRFSPRLTAEQVQRKLHGFMASEH